MRQRLCQVLGNVLQFVRSSSSGLSVETSAAIGGSDDGADQVMATKRERLRSIDSCVLCGRCTHEALHIITGIDECSDVTPSTAQPCNCCRITESSSGTTSSPAAGG
jgi:hypothetical protein